MTHVPYETDKKANETLKKVFIGGLVDTTDDDSLKAYFGQFGEISDCVVIKDQNKVSRKFGFVTCENMASTNACIKQKKHAQHTVDGKEVDVKRAIPRELGYISRGKKAFVGGIPKDLKDKDLIDLFHGCEELELKVEEVLLIKDKVTDTNKGFGFVTFEEEDQVDKVATVRKFKLPSGKELEVKHAEPKNGEGGQGGGRGRGGRGGGMGRGRGRGGSAGGFGGNQGYQQWGNDQWGNGNNYGYDSYGGGYDQGYQSYDNGYNQYDSYGAAQTQGYDQGGYGGAQGGYNQGGGGGGRRGGRGGGGRYTPY